MAKQLFHTNEGYVALPFALINYGTISNLNVFLDDSITGTANECINVGVIASQNYGIITNCHVSGNIEIITEENRVKIGGIAIINKRIIRNCTNSWDAIIKSQNNFTFVCGGIAGESENEITECGFSGKMYISTGAANVTSSSSFIGGICGNTYSNSIINQCYFDGDIVLSVMHNQYNGIVNYLGGISGIGSSNSSFNVQSIRDCLSAGTLLLIGDGLSCQGDSYSMGGILGRLSNLGGAKITVSTCYSSSYIESYYADCIMRHIIGSDTNMKFPITYCYSVDPNPYFETKDLIEQGYMRTMSQMKEQSTFQGFDFDGVWIMGAYDNYFYPTLRSMKSAPIIKPLGIYIEKLPKLTSYFEGEKFDFTDMVIKRVFNNGSEEITDQWGVYFTDENNQLYYGDNIFKVVYDDGEYTYYELLTIKILEQKLIGDLNADGEIDSLDLSNLKRYLIDNTYKTHTIVADFNEDGEIDVKDLIRMKKYFAGNI